MSGLYLGVCIIHILKYIYIYKVGASAGTVAVGRRVGAAGAVTGLSKVLAFGRVYIRIYPFAGHAKAIPVDVISVPRQRFTSCPAPIPHRRRVNKTKAFNLVRIYCTAAVPRS